MAETPTPTETTKRAHRLDRWIVRHYGVPENYTAVPEIAAALRQAESSALERAAQDFERRADCAIDNSQEYRFRLIAEELRALIPPAAAPAAAQMDAPTGPVCGCGKPSRYESGWCGETNCFTPAAETGKAQTIEININDSVWVKVTPAGEQVYRQHWTALKMDPPPLRRNADGRTEFQLWELANVFGAAMYNGCSVPVETTIRIATPAPAREDRDLAEDWQDRCETAHARIAELEGALRHAWGHARNAGCSGYLGQDFFARIEKVLATRAAPPEGEGK